jgi:DUF917 family protein
MFLNGELVPTLAKGCAVLGAGGGGETRTGTLSAQQALIDHGSVPLVDVDELPEHGIVMPIGVIGAPTIGLEKLPDLGAARRLRGEVERRMGAPVVAVMASEIGGSNGLLPLAWAADLGLPVLDADSTGRAFPEVQQVAMHVAGLKPELIALTDTGGNVVVLHVVSGEWAERLGRNVAVTFGGCATMVDYPMRLALARDVVLHGTVSLAMRIGSALEAGGDGPVSNLVAELGARRLIDGKVADVERRLSGGFVRGSATIEGGGADAGRLLRLEIQNENLAAFDNGRVLATVPDLICVLDAHTGEAIATEVLRYGQRVAVIAFPCHPIWRTPRGLDTAGPRAFGLDLDYVPVEDIEEATCV